MGGFGKSLRSGCRRENPGKRYAFSVSWSKAGMQPEDFVKRM